MPPSHKSGQPGPVERLRARYSGGGFDPADPACAHPQHGDVWTRDKTDDRFSVMHVCGHHDPPHVTGYWHDASGMLNPCRHASIPLPRFLASFTLTEREEARDAA